MEKILFFDTEIQPKSGKLLDIGAVRTDGMQLHAASAAALSDFAKGYPFVCGHNIIAHDLRFVHDSLPAQYLAIDTLCLSPLLFPMRPYHALVKDDKLQSGTLNNPLNDAMKARELFFDEYSAYRALPSGLRRIYCTLLGGTPQFHGFFRLVGERTAPDPVLAVRNFFEGKLCTNAPLELLIRKVPIELAYTLALIHTDDRHSVPPPWVLRNYPRINNVIRLLRGTPCADGCPYCSRKLDVRAQLKDIFGFDSFRTYNGQPLQENAGYVERGKNMPRVYATSILVDSMEEAVSRLDQSRRFDPRQKLNAKRIIKSLISSRSISKAGNDDAESRVDYLADILGIEKEEIIASINLMREEGLLADSMDLSAFIRRQDTQNRSSLIVNRFAKLEEFLIDRLHAEPEAFSYKEVNDEAISSGLPRATIKDIKTIVYFWTIRRMIRKDIKAADTKAVLCPTMDLPAMKRQFRQRVELAHFIVERLFTMSAETQARGREFDRVYLLLNRSELTEAGAKRVVYVALTRARRELHVHYTGRFMEGQSVPGAAYRNDNTLYPEPEEIVLHLTHRDVVLDFFKSRKRKTLSLRSGQAMTGDGAYLLCDGRRSAKLSQKCQQLLADLGKRGYRIKNAEIRFIVAWKGENDTEETTILLPTLYLGK